MAFDYSSYPPNSNFSGNLCIKPLFSNNARMLKTAENYKNCKRKLSFLNFARFVCALTPREFCYLINQIIVESGSPAH